MKSSQILHLLNEKYYLTIKSVRELEIMIIIIIEYTIRNSNQMTIRKCTLRRDALLLIEQINKY